jgi:hypothetical protein
LLAVVAVLEEQVLVAALVDTEPLLEHQAAAHLLKIH